MTLINRRFALKILAVLICLPASAFADNILTFGDYSSSRASLTTALESLGHTVTTQATLPADLSGFDTIWHVGAYVPLTGPEQTALAAYLASGGGVHLTGERPCCEDLNDSLEQFVNTVVIGGGVQVGGLGDIGGPYAMNPAAKGGISSSPNSVSVWVPSASGGMGGIGSLPDSNILATGSSDIPVGAVWDESDLVSGNGRLTLFMDVNWFGQLGSGDNTAITENIQVFLASGSVSPPPTPREVVPVPTLSTWSILAITVLLALFAAMRLRQTRL